MVYEVGGSVHHAEVIHYVKSVDGETKQYLVHLGDEKRKEIMTYDAIVEAIAGQLTSEVKKTDEEYL
eukprot:4636437-Ditylum_brightwellii.AAC.1